MWNKNNDECIFTPIQTEHKKDISFENEQNDKKCILFKMTENYLQKYGFVVISYDNKGMMLWEIISSLIIEKNKTNFELNDCYISTNKHFVDMYNKYGEKENFVCHLDN